MSTLKDPSEEPMVQITMTISQANAMNLALDTYSRLCIGQLEEVWSLVNAGTVPISTPHDLPRAEASIEACDQIQAIMKQAKAILGFASNSSMGIGNPHVDVTGHRAWELRKALSKELAYHRDPNPSFKGVDYDGNVVRYTSDPLPIVKISKDMIVEMDIENPFQITLITHPKKSPK
ncbi:MAG: hypothetical protein ACJAUZ_002390 [Flavobacteriaceae bacterium]|jgi:hypothetical protein